MPNKKLLYLIIFILATSTFLSGCIEIKTKATPRDGGIFKTADRGESWLHKVSAICYPSVTPEKNHDCLS